MLRKWLSRHIRLGGREGCSKEDDTEAEPWVTGAQPCKEVVGRREEECSRQCGQPGQGPCEGLVFWLVLQPSRIKKNSVVRKWWTETEVLGETRGTGRAHQCKGPPVPLAPPAASRVMLSAALQHTAFICQLQTYSCGRKRQRSLLFWNLRPCRGDRLLKIHITRKWPSAFFCPVTNAINKSRVR